MWLSRLRNYARRLIVLALVAGGATSTGAFTGTPPASGVAVGAGITVRLPAGWHLLGGRLSDVVNPIPRLAIASFPARLSRHECACGSPNVVDFPRGGAFVFVWEYRGLSRHDLLKSFPRRPDHFDLSRGHIGGYACSGPSDSLVFREHGREFQAEVYVAAGITPRVRAQLLSVLDSFDASSLNSRGTSGSHR
jgi:hypothetical protein